MNGYKVVTTAPQGSQEWLDARMNGIGGSEVAAVLGMNPYKSPVEVWLEKCGKSEPFSGNDRTMWGHKLEPVVRAHYSEQHPGWWVDEVPGVLAHPDIPVAQASLDGLVNNKEGQRLLEVKCTAQTWERPPDMYLYQALWYMAITGIPVTDFAVLSKGNTYTEYTVERDDAVCDYMLSEVNDWWHIYVLGGVQPPIDLARDRDLLQRIWTADVTAEAVTLDQTLIAALRDTKAALAAARTDYEMAAAAVQAEMRESVAAVDAAGDKVATWNATKARESIDVKRLRREHPDLAAELTMYSQPGRMFRTYQ